MKVGMARRKVCKKQVEGREVKEERVKLKRVGRRECKRERL
jgi:hypothetical protein